jgi:energy-converting hydrogenase B subunit Q
MAIRALPELSPSIVGDPPSVFPWGRSERPGAIGPSEERRSGQLRSGLIQGFCSVEWAAIGYTEIPMATETVGLLVRASARTGLLHLLTGVIARYEGDIASVEILENRPESATTYFEVNLPGSPDALLAELRALPVVQSVDPVKTLSKIYGKRIIIMGGGAQVGQVAIGAISEADRHNIRGEHISVDTIPLVGEQKLADAVRAVARLPRAKALVLAGSLMGGEIETAVREVRQAGLLVVSLNMAGSVPDAADLVVTDPVQAGVMTVMAVADTAKFTVDRLDRRTF